MGCMAGSALLFPGQGSHAADMDATWRGTPLFEHGLELLGYDPFADLGMGTRAQQPAIFLVCACAWDSHEGGQEVAAAGHSLGEYAALHAAGALAFAAALLLVDERAAAMQPAADRLRAALAARPIAQQAFPVWSNGSAAPFVDIRRELAENLLKPVRWRETLLALRAHGVERFVELGPGAVLTGMVKRTLAVAA